MNSNDIFVNKENVQIIIRLISKLSLISENVVTYRSSYIVKFLNTLSSFLQIPILLLVFLLTLVVDIVKIAQQEGTDLLERLTHLVQKNSVCLSARKYFLAYQAVPDKKYIPFYNIYMKVNILSENVEEETENQKMLDN